MLELIARPRRNRRTAGLRAFTREAELRADRFVYPLFIHAGQGKQLHITQLWRADVHRAFVEGMLGGAG